MGTTLNDQPWSYGNTQSYFTPIDEAFLYTDPESCTIKPSESASRSGSPSNSDGPNDDDGADGENMSALGDILAGAARYQKRMRTSRLKGSSGPAPSRSPTIARPSSQSPSTTLNSTPPVGSSSTPYGASLSSSVLPSPPLAAPASVPESSPSRSIVQYFEIVAEESGIGSPYGDQTVHLPALLSRADATKVRSDIWAHSPIIVSSSTMFRAPTNLLDFHAAVQAERVTHCAVFNRPDYRSEDLVAYQKVSSIMYATESFVMLAPSSFGDSGSGAILYPYLEERTGRFKLNIAHFTTLPPFLQLLLSTPIDQMSFWTDVSHPVDMSLQDPNFIVPGADFSHPYLPSDPFQAPH